MCSSLSISAYASLVARGSAGVWDLILYTKRNFGSRGVANGAACSCVVGSWHRGCLYLYTAHVKYVTVTVTVAGWVHQFTCGAKYPHQALAKMGGYFVFV